MDGPTGKRRRQRVSLYGKRTSRGEPELEELEKEEYGPFYFGAEPEPSEDAAVVPRRRRRRPVEDVGTSATGAFQLDYGDDDVEVPVEEEDFELGQGALIPGPAAAGADRDPGEAAAGGAAAGGVSAQPAGGAAAAAPPAVGVHPRIDIDDDFCLFGDVSSDVLVMARRLYLPLVLQGWARRHVIAEVAVTSLLQLMHGEWGKVLGVKSEHLVRGGVLPQTAHTAFKSGAELAQALGIAGLLLPHRVELPEDNSLKGKGSQHSVGVWYSPDLALLIALKLMDPLLNSRETPMFFEPEPRLPAGLVSGPTYFSADETRQRRAAIERALAALPALLKRLLPGVDPATVRIIAIGLSSFIDAVNPQNNQATSVYAFLLGISNLHPAVAQSPLGVVLAGLWNPPTVVSAKKVAGEDTSMTASKRTQGNRAAVDAFSQEAAVARPMRKLLQREPLVMHTRLFPGLWNVPEQVGGGAAELATVIRTYSPSAVRCVLFLPQQDACRRACHGQSYREGRAARFRRRRARGGAEQGA